MSDWARIELSGEAQRQVTRSRGWSCPLPWARRFHKGGFWQVSFLAEIGGILSETSRRGRVWDTFHGILGRLTHLIG